MMKYRKKFVVISVFVCLFAEKVISAQTFEVEKMALKSTGYKASSAWVLDKVGFVADTITIEQAGFYRFNVRAKKIGANMPTKLEIKVGGKVCGPVFVKNPSYSNYRVLCYLASGIYQFSIWRTDSNVECQLALDKIQIYPVEFEEKDWLIKAAESVLERYPAPWNFSATDSQTEELIWGMANAFLQTLDNRYLSYVRSFIDNHVMANGDPDFEIRDVTPGIIMLWLFQMTNENKYLIAAQKIGQYLLTGHPRTSDGALLHSDEADGEIWAETLNGVGRFFALLAATAQDNQFFDNGANQFLIYASHLQDENTGLFYHAWDEDKSADWSDPLTGTSSAFWTRSNAWVLNGLVDFLEYLPDEHPQRAQLLVILKKLAYGIREQRDENSGLWHEVLNIENDSSNYEDTAANLILACGLAKAINLKLLGNGFTEILQSVNLELYRRVYEIGKSGTFITGISNECTPGNASSYLNVLIANDEIFPLGMGVFLQEKSELTALEEPNLKIFSFQINDVTNNSAIISWRTNSQSDSRIDYGINSIYDNFITSSQFEYFHSIEMTGLEPETIYHIRVSSTDRNGLTVASSDTTFSTLPFMNLSFSNITISSGFAIGNEDNLIGGHGVQFCDVDNDGSPDIYLTRFFEQPIADFFFHNDGQGYFLEQAAARGLADFDGGSHGASFADLDNDGDYDLINGTTHDFSGNADNNNLYRNDGNGYFSEMTPEVFLNNRWPTRAVLPFDMDNDGDLDIFAVSGYLGWQDPPDELNEIYRNDGNFQFTLIDSSILRYAWVGQGATAADYDNDGDLDVFAGNRTGPLNIFQNDGKGNFIEIEPSTIGIFNQGRESITFGDIDSDSWLDMLLVGDTTGYYAYLYKNSGGGNFTFMREFESIEGYMGAFADIDNDGDLDIIFAGDDVCYLNDGTGNFETGPEIPVDGANDARAISFADIDGDGDLDFAVGCKRSRSLLIRNNLRGGNWIDVKLESANGQAGAFGTRVYIFDSDSSQKLILMQEATGSQGYLGQNDPVLHFGVAGRAFVNIKARFLDGNVVELENVPVNQTIFIKPGILPVEVVTTPSVSVLDSELIIGKEIHFEAEGSKSNLAHELEYQFFWGDSIISAWNDSIQTHIYNFLGTYGIKARARCTQDTNVISDWSNEITINLRGLNCNVSVSPDSSGFVLIEPAKSFYEYNEEIKLTANPDTNFEFDQWEGDISGSENPYQFLISKDMDISAKFSKIVETITMPMKPEGPDSLYVGQPGVFITGHALSNLNHKVEYQFDWGDSTVSDWGDSTNSHPYFDTGEYDIFARARCSDHDSIFSEMSEAKSVRIEPIRIFLEIVPDSGGTVIVSPQKKYFVYLDTVSFLPVANKDMKFKKWSGDFDSDSAALKIVLTHGVSIQCVFENIEEILSQPDSIFGRKQLFRKQDATFIAVGGRSNLNHQIEYQFNWGDGSLSSWGDSVRSKNYVKNGNFEVRGRVRCIEDTTVVSDWSRALNVEVRGCRISESVIPEDGGVIKVSPQKEDYDFKDSITVVPEPSAHYKFWCWESVGDTIKKKVIEIIGDTTITAKFKMLSGVIRDENKKPGKFELNQNYPNPFNEQTLVKFQIPNFSHVSLKIYNLMGQKVCTIVDSELSPGFYHYRWNGRNENNVALPTGIYWFILRDEEKSLIKKLIILR